MVATLAPPVLLHLAPDLALPLEAVTQTFAILTGVAVTGGTFNTYLGTLRREGFLTLQGTEIHITPAGLAYLGTGVPPAPATTTEILAIWRDALRKGEWRMLEALVEVYPATLSRTQLGARTDITPSGGTFGTYLGTLRRNGLITVEGDQVQASSTLFLDGVAAPGGTL